MKKLLIYGDSNVWGDNFLTGIRIPDEKQWVNILQKDLGNEYKVIQEGLPGRLAGTEEQEKKYKNGKDTFISTYRTNAPIDILIIALGSNDLQLKYNKNSNQIINDLLWYRNILEDMIKNEDDKKKYFINNKLPYILYVLPSNFDYKLNASMIFNENKEIERQEIIKYFIDNNINNIYFDDIELFDDGIHFNYKGHKQMSEKVLKQIKTDFK